MSKAELLEVIDKISVTLDNAKRTLHTTNINVYIVAKYICSEIDVNIKNIKWYGNIYYFYSIHFIHWFYNCMYCFFHFRINCVVF